MNPLTIIAVAACAVSGFGLMLHTAPETDTAGLVSESTVYTAPLSGTVGLDSPCVVHSVGYRISRPNARHLCLAQSITDEQGSDNVLFIPARMVRKVIKLQIPHKRRKMR